MYVIECSPECMVRFEMKLDGESERGIASGYYRNFMHVSDAFFTCIIIHAIYLIPHVRYGGGGGGGHIQAPCIRYGRFLLDRCVVHVQMNSIVHC